MSDSKILTDTKKPCCEGKTDKKELVLATQLPLHGNPYPPKDVIEIDKPSFLELKVKAVRTTIQPYTAPIASAYNKTSDILSIGAAHTQSSLQSLADNQNSFVSALVIAGSGLLGFGVTRRRGILTRLLVTSALVGGATTACYPKEAEEKSQVLWYIAKNKIPVYAKQQYEKLQTAAKGQKDSDSK